MTNFKKEAPWYSDYEEFIEQFNLKTLPERKRVYWIARMHYKYTISPDFNESITLLKQKLSSKNKKTFLGSVLKLTKKDVKELNSSFYYSFLKETYQSRKWIFATAFAGQFNDETAEKFQQLFKHLGKNNGDKTGRIYTKKYNQDWNAAFWSSLDHVAVVYAAAETFQYTQDFSTQGLIAYTAASLFAVGNLVYNAYRLINRDDKARAAYGYGAIASQVMINMYDKGIVPEFVDRVKLRALSNNTNQFYAGLEVLIKDTIDETKKQAKQFNSFMFS